MRNGKKLSIGCAMPTNAAKKIPLSVWSVGNLISTALRLLQSKTSDSGDCIEQMEEMNLYDNIGDEKEKQ